MAQSEIPGTERPKIPELDEVIDRYVKIRDKRMELTKQEIEARQAIEKHLADNKLQTYTHSDGERFAYLTEAEVKAKVKLVNTDPGDEV